MGEELYTIWSWRRSQKCAAGAGLLGVLGEVDSSLCGNSSAKPTPVDLDERLLSPGTIEPSARNLSAGEERSHQKERPAE